MTKEEAISTLSEIRAEYNCYELRDERIRYHALSMGIEALEERKHGEWGKIDNWTSKCSICGKVTLTLSHHKKYNFCPHCGARLRGE